MNRRDALKVATGFGLAMALPASVEAIATPTEHEVLVECRDRIREMVGDGGTCRGLTLGLAVLQLDHAIMQRCPHDPEMHIFELENWIADDIKRSMRVTCPACRATTDPVIMKGHSS